VSSRAGGEVTHLDLGRAARREVASWTSGRAHLHVHARVHGHGLGPVHGRGRVYRPPARSCWLGFRVAPLPNDDLFYYTVDGEVEMDGTQHEPFSCYIYLLVKGVRSLFFSSVLELPTLFDYNYRNCHRLT
jgi:hypothetical protein